MLQRLLAGEDVVSGSNLRKSLYEDPAQPDPRFLMKLIDVSRTSKGTKSGGLQSFSAMVVVGDGQVSRQTRT